MDKNSSTYRNAKAQISINSTKEAIFNVISDHEATFNWVKKVNKVRLTKEGTPKNGIGAIRKVNFKPILWGDVLEEVVAYTQNEGFQYKILSGMPGLVKHLGIWTLEEIDNGEVLVTWDIHFEFKKFHWFRLIVNYFIKSFNQVQKGALCALKVKTEKSIH